MSCIVLVCKSMAIHNSLSCLPSPFLSPPKLSFFATPNSTLHFTRLTNRPKLFTVQFQNGAVSSPSPAVGEDLPVDYADWLPRRDPNERRRAGILLHPTSFPGPYGIGDLGDQAFRFLDWLHDAGCSLWQVQFPFSFDLIKCNILIINNFLSVRFHSSTTISFCFIHFFSTPGNNLLKSGA